MKKIILLLLLVPNMVMSKEVYTEYERYLNDSNELIKSSDLIKSEEIFLYNTYIEEIEERHAQINTLDDSYTINLNDYYLEERKTLEKTEYSSYYQTKCLNNYTDITDIKIIIFSSNLNLSEISYDSKNDIKVRLGIDNYNGEDKNILFDNKLYNETITMTSQSFITFRLLKTTDLDNLTLKLYFPKQGEKVINFKIILNYSNNIYGTFELNDEDKEINISFDKLYKEFLKDNNFKTENECISYYSEEIPYYKHTKISKIPLNNYIPLNDNNMFLLDDYIKKYNYYKREKLEIEDNIILENEKLDIFKYLKTTIPIDKLKIINDINYEKSGNYTIKIYYQEILLLVHPITYKTTDEEKVIVNNVENKPIKSKSKKTINTKIKEKITVQSKNKIQNKTITTNNVKKINNNIILDKKDNKKTLIIILTSLIFLLTIFEIILLYVKHKYF